MSKENHLFPALQAAFTCGKAKTDAAAHSEQNKVMETALWLAAREDAGSESADADKEPV